MKTFLLVAVLLVAFVSAAHIAADQREFIQFKLWASKFNKKYSSPVHQKQAFENFKRSAANVKSLQEKNPHAVFQLNAFSDGLGKRRVPLTKPSAPMMTGSEIRGATVPTTLDWRVKGAVTPVKNQGYCGSEEVFAAVANIEGVNFVVNKKLVELSEQELIDCDGDGCNGGLFVTPYAWLLKHTDGKIATMASYPSNNGQGTCNLKNITVGAQITAYHTLSSDEDVMRDYTATHGPIAVAIDGTALQIYTSGIITDCPASQVDTAVAVVGYNDESNPPYWIIKNSWGTSWGMSGYAYIEKGSNACGITSMPMSATAKKI